MPEEVVNDGQQQAASGADDGKKAAPAADPNVVTLSKKEFESLKARQTELENGMRYWADRAERSAPAAAAKQEAEADDDGEDWSESDIPADKLIDLLTTEGKAGLKKAGLVGRGDLKAILEKQEAKFNQRLESLTSRQKAASDEQAILSQYPDLAKPDSEFFANVLEEIKASGAAIDPKKGIDPTLLRMAARNVKRTMDAAAEMAKRSDRAARIAAQAGDSGVGGGEDEGGDDELSPMQRLWLDKFNADGGTQVSEEAYRRRAKSGVRMSTRAAFAAGPNDNGGAAAAARQQAKKDTWDTMNFDWGRQ